MDRDDRGSGPPIRRTTRSTANKSPLAALRTPPPKKRPTKKAARKAEAPVESKGENTSEDRETTKPAYSVSHSVSPISEAPHCGKDSKAQISPVAAQKTPVVATSTQEASTQTSPSHSPVAATSTKQVLTQISPVCVSVAPSAPTKVAATESAFLLPELNPLAGQELLPLTQEEIALVLGHRSSKRRAFRAFIRNQSKKRRVSTDDDGMETNESRRVRQRIDPDSSVPPLETNRPPSRSVRSRGRTERNVGSATTNRFAHIPGLDMTSGNTRQVLSVAGLNKPAQYNSDEEMPPVPDSLLPVTSKTPKSSHPNVHSKTPTRGTATSSGSSSENLTDREDDEEDSSGEGESGQVGDAAATLQIVDNPGQVSGMAPPKTPVKTDWSFSNITNSISRVFKFTAGDQSNPTPDGRPSSSLLAQGSQSVPHHRIGVAAPQAQAPATAVRPRHRKQIKPKTKEAKPKDTKPKGKKTRGTKTKDAGSQEAGPQEAGSQEAGPKEAEPKEAGPQWMQPRVRKLVDTRPKNINPFATFGTKLVERKPSGEPILTGSREHRQWRKERTARILREHAEAEAAKKVEEAAQAGQKRKRSDEEIKRICGHIDPKNFNWSGHFSVPEPSSSDESDEEDAGSQSRAEIGRETTSIHQDHGNANDVDDSQEQRPAKRARVEESTVEKPLPPVYRGAKFMRGRPTINGVSYPPNKANDRWTVRIGKAPRQPDPPEAVEPPPEAPVASKPAKKTKKIIVHRTYHAPPGASYGLADDFNIDSDSDVEMEVTDDEEESTETTTSHESTSKSVQGSSSNIPSDSGNIFTQAAQDSETSINLVKENFGGSFKDKSTKEIDTPERSVTKPTNDPSPTESQSPILSTVTQTSKTSTPNVITGTENSIKSAPVVSKADDKSSKPASSSTQWTQSPPPRPHPAHAELPSGLPQGTSDQLEVQETEDDDKIASPPADPLTKARSRAEKYKPKTPSGLRASSRLSTTSTVYSEANDDTLALVPAPTTELQVLDQPPFNEEPESIVLQLPPTIDGTPLDPEVEAALATLTPEDDVVEDLDLTERLEIDPADFGIDSNVWQLAVADFEAYWPEQMEIANEYLSEEVADWKAIKGDEGTMLLLTST
ncbi:MAG: hypothetical protein M1837_003718 [Sclerophora amabilis]|nr:MAG: hypothetical protein M1837_003718 [Sclerophora amabilis]